jgi:hypothetical protein
MTHLAHNTVGQVANQIRALFTNFCSFVTQDAHGTLAIFLLSVGVVFNTHLPYFTNFLPVSSNTEL